MDDMGWTFLGFSILALIWAISYLFHRVGELEKKMDGLIYGLRAEHEQKKLDEEWDEMLEKASDRPQFVPADPKEHALAVSGRTVLDFCLNCGHPFVQHTAGKWCPDGEGRM